MTVIHESELAWDLVEFNANRFEDDERSMAFVHLGAGDFLLALLLVLKFVVRKQIKLPADFNVRLQVWAETYDISRAERDLLVQAIGGSPHEMTG